MKESTTNTTKGMDLLATRALHGEQRIAPLYGVCAIHVTPTVVVVVVEAMMRVYECFGFRPNENILRFSKIVAGSHPVHTYIERAKER